MDQDIIDILKQEFNAEEGSFLHQIRSHLNWDKTAFSRLTTTMLLCCQAMAQEEMLPRWLAEGFWYVPRFVRAWTTHPAWNTMTAEEPIYYEKAYERLDDLAYWFFTGESLYLDPAKGYAPM